MTCSGSVFQMRAPATGKPREPMEVSRTADQVLGSRGPDGVLYRMLCSHPVGFPVAKLPYSSYHLPCQIFSRCVRDKKRHETRNSRRRLISHCVAHRRRVGLFTRHPVHTPAARVVKVIKSVINQIIMCSCSFSLESTNKKAINNPASVHIVITGLYRSPLYFLVVDNFIVLLLRFIRPALGLNAN